MRRIGVTFWAFIASLIVHAIILLFFGISRFPSLLSSENPQPVVTAGLSRLESLADGRLITPKPHVRAVQSQRIPERFGAEQVFARSRLQPATLEQPKKTSGAGLWQSTSLAAGAEFFGIINRKFGNDIKGAFWFETGNAFDLFQTVKNDIASFLIFFI